jgi:hypothetical protein
MRQMVFQAEEIAVHHRTTVKVNTRVNKRDAHIQ